MKRRYYVIEIVGWPITPSSGPSWRKPGASYSVLDRYDCHREIFRVTSTRNPRLPAWCKAQAKAECARLNRLERAQVAT